MSIRVLDIKGIPEPAPRRHKGRHDRRDMAGSKCSTALDQVLIGLREARWMATIVQNARRMNSSESPPGNWPVAGRTSRRCECGLCHQCRSNQKWDRLSAALEVRDRPQDWKVFPADL